MKDQASGAELEERLVQADESVLAEILRQLGPAVAARLQTRFAGSLTSADVEDIVSVALYRLWKYRDRFDARKGALKTWFYLIARNAAFDMLRKVRQHNVQLSEEFADDPLTIPFSDDESTPMEPMESSHAASRAAKVLVIAMEQLPELDQQILLAFANSGSEQAWASGLADELNIPASTIRSRKHRALAKVRDYIQQHSINPQTGVPEMASGPQQELVTTATAERSFVDQYRAKLEDLANRIVTYWHAEDQETQFAKASTFLDPWNVAVADGDASEVLDALTDTFQWMGVISTERDQYKQQLHQFFRRCEEHDSSVKQTALANANLRRRIERLENSLSAVATKMQRDMPREIYRTGKGDLKFDWIDGDDVNASLTWVTSAGESVPLPYDLRELTLSCFATHGRLNRVDASVMADELMAEIKFRRQLEIPNLSYPTGLKPTQATPELHWKSDEVTDVQLRQFPLPHWIKNKSTYEVSMPSEFQVELNKCEAELGLVIDEILCAAAVHDHQYAGDDRESAIKSTVEFLAERADCTPADIAELIGTRLASTQHDQEGTPCVINKKAVAVLFSSFT